jgi:hypothetical protein
MGYTNGVWSQMPTFRAVGRFVSDWRPTVAASLLRVGPG